MLIADDHAAVREGLRALLETAREIRVVGDAADGENTLRLAIELRPDVLVLDNSMPGRTGVDVARTLADRRPEVAVIIYTAEARPCRSLPSNVFVVLPKDARPAELVEAVRRASAVMAARAALGSRPIEPPSPWWRPVVEIALPLRYGRRFGAPSFSLVFLAALGEFHALSTAGLSTFGLPLDLAALQWTLLPMDWLVAAAAASAAYAIFAGRRRPAGAPAPTR